MSSADASRTRAKARWTVEAAINESVPAPVISAALWQRFESTGRRGLHGQGALGDARGLRRTRGEVLVVHHELRVYETAEALARGGGSFRSAAQSRPRLDEPSL